MSPIVSVPCPPAFLDPLTEVDTCYYYAVPKFFGQNHPSTRWLITMIKNNEEDNLKHKMETSPFAFKGVYYQMMDYPQMYIPEDVAAAPMFKRQAVVYLTPLGMAIYLGNAEIVDLLLNYKDVYDDPICDPNEPQYATHLQDNDVGDFHSFPPFLVMMRRSCFGCVQPLLRAGWDPSKPVAMPMRRKFERRVLYYRDWLEVALSVMATRPMYLLQVLVRHMVTCSAYKPLKMPMKQLLSPNQEDPVGLIDVSQLPPGTPMIGVRSLLDMAEQYDCYLQMRHCAKQVAELKREAVAVGLNPEVLMIQAQDFDGGDVVQPEQTEGSNAARGVNNSSAADNQAQARLLKLNVNASAKKDKESTDPPYVSEGCRILHYALMRDSKGKSMQTCLEAFCVLLRRGFYLQPAKPAVLSSLARDIRNIVVLLLNLVQREQSKVDMFVEKIKYGVKRFSHLEEHKQLENRKTACIQFMSKLVGVLTKLLLHAKLVVDFIQVDFPPYRPVLTNIALNPYLAQNFQEIKFGIIREFNLCNDAWVFLDKEMLQAVSGMPAIQLHLKVGTKPKIVLKSNAANKNKSNMINTNSCFVSYTRVQRRPKPPIRIPRATPASSIAETSVTDAVAETSCQIVPAPLRSEDGSAACLDMDNSADLATSCTGEAAADLGDDGDMQDFRQIFVKPVDSSAVSGSLNKQQSPPPPAAQAPALGDSPDMEQLLASLCREVDCLFRPLEDRSCGGEPRWVATRSALVDATRSSDAAAGGLNECSTIEPELASTPVPTPGPSPVPNLSGTADVEAATLNCSHTMQLSRRQQPPLPPALRKKLKQSRVLQRLLSRRQPARDGETDAADSNT